MNQDQVKKFYEEFQAPLGFIVPDPFPIARGHGVLIKRDSRAESETFSVAGIFLPAQSTASRFVGRIYAIGPEVKWLKPGMKVIYNAFADQHILYKSVEYTTMSDIDVFYVLPEDAETMQSNPQKEERKQYTYDEMPSINRPKEEIQEEQERAKEYADVLKRAATTKTYGMGDSSKSEPENNS